MYRLFVLSSKVRARLFLTVIIGILVWLFAATVTGAQAPPTPGPELRTPVPACQLYHLTVNEGRVRSCAGTNCQVTGSVVSNTPLCIRGISDNSNWYLIDLVPEDTTSPLYYISADIIAPGPPGRSTPIDPDACDPYEVSASEAIVRQCPSTSCPVIGSLANGTYICALNYGGEYSEWIYASYSDGDLVGWMHGSVLEQLSTRTPTPPGGAPVAASTPTPPATQVVATPVPGAPPEVTANVDANVRQGDSTSYARVGVLRSGQRAPILGVSSNNTGWYFIQLPDGQRGWIAPSVVTVSGDVSTAPRVDPATTGAVPAVSAQQTPAAIVSATPSPQPTGRPTCQYHVVTVDAAVARTNPSDSAPIAATLGRNTPVCVLEPVPYLENEWFVVDLAPQSATGAVSFMRQVLLAPSPDLMPTPAATAVPQGAGQPPDTAPTATPPVCPTAVPTTVNPFVATATHTATATMTNTPTATQQATRGTTTPATAQRTPTASPTASPSPTATATTTPAPAMPANCVTATPTPILAPPPTQVASGPLLAQDISLASLRVPNFVMTAPQGSAQFRLLVPENWLPGGSNVLYLNLEYFQSTTNQTPGFEDTNLVSLIDVFLDDNLISTISLSAATVGPQTLAIPLPADILANPTRRSHTIQLSFDATDQCRSRVEARVLVRSDQSFFHFEYQQFLPTLDLARYPRPFYNSSLPTEAERVLVVLPPEPEPADVEAAASLAAGLGNLTSGAVQISVVNANELSESARRDNNLILVGQIGTHPLIDALYATNLFPTQLEPDGRLTVSDLAIEADDGIVQLIAHPENPMRAILAVTSKTQEGLLKAAQAMAGPPSLLGLGGPLAIVSEVRPVNRLPAAAIESRLTLADLGYADLTVNGLGTHRIEVEFDMPPGTFLTNDAYVDLLLNHAQTLSAEGARTTVALTMNDAPLAAMMLTPQTADGSAATTANVSPGRMQAPIPPSSVIPGQRNRLTIVVDIQGDWGCAPPGPDVTWFSVRSDSVLNLPRQFANPLLLTPQVSWFPAPFNALPDLRDVWVSLPSEPTTKELEQTLQLMARLGAATPNGEGFSPQISFGDLPPGVDLADYHFIVIGRPTTNPFLAALNENLPQPFVPGTDELQQILDDVSYRLPPGYDVGILQTLKSPWAPERTILVLTGTGANGQANAINVLVSELYGASELEGDVVFASANAVSAVDTRTIEESVEILTAVPELSTQSAIAAQATPTPVIVFTVTPGPTLTPTPTNTIGPTPTPTALFTLTPTPTVPTPIPTFPPLPTEALAAPPPETPAWVEILVIITVASLGVTGLYGVFRLVRWLREREP